MLGRWLVNGKQSGEMRHPRQVPIGHKPLHISHCVVSKAPQRLLDEKIPIGERVRPAKLNRHLQVATKSLSF